MAKKSIQTIAVFFILLVIIVAGCAQKSEKKAEEITKEEVTDTGALVVESAPSNAQVYVNGELKGETPLTLYNQPGGTYSLVVKKGGYADFEKAVTIKVGKTEEINAELSQLPSAKVGEEKKMIEESKTFKETMTNFNKINLSSFAMYYDFEGMQFTEIRTDKSDLFSRRYDNYVHFTPLTPAKIYLLNKPIKEVKKEDCIFSDIGVAQLFSGQTLCVSTMEGSLVAIGGSWDKVPTELEWILFS